jgi:hypothetical protein
MPIYSGASLNATQIQNALVLCMILGYAATEIISRRYKNTVHATANDTKLELFMFVSLLAITQPLAMLVTAKLQRHIGRFALVGHGGLAACVR